MSRGRCRYSDISQQSATLDSAAAIKRHTWALALASAPHPHRNQNTNERPPARAPRPNHTHRHCLVCTPHAPIESNRWVSLAQAIHASLAHPLVTWLVPAR